MSSKRLLLYATDAYKLSSLILRRVIQEKPTTLDAFREKTRQLLLDQSRSSTPTLPSSPSANVAAIKLLELDREWNLMKYHGAQEYAKRWWSSRSWSFSISGNTTQSSQMSNQPETNNMQRGDSTKKNVARVAFMITSEQRHILSTKLGYTTQDIRSFKPIEALLLLEHGVKRESDDFRAKLKELVEENERLMSMQHQEQSQAQSKKESDSGTATDHSPSIETDQSTERLDQQSSVSPEEAQQMHAKPDVALALLSADKDLNHKEGSGCTMGTDEVMSYSSPDPKAAGDATALASTYTNAEKEMPVAAAPSTEESVPAATFHPISVTSGEAEDLHMKPDVAAAILTSHQQEGLHEQQQLVDDKDDVDEVDDNGPSWYEVVERLPAVASASDGGNGNQSSLPAPHGEQVVALFPTKKEALECVRIKKSFRSCESNASNDAERSEDERFLVRRRWNI